MSILSQLRDSLWGRSKAALPQPVAPPSSLRGSEYPPFTMQTAEAMRYDPQIRIGLGARNGLLLNAQAQAISEHAAIAQFVQEQWNRIWKCTAHILLRAKVYGYLPLEAVFRETRGGAQDGRLEFDCFMEHHPSQARLLMHNGMLAGFRLHSNTKHERDVLAPVGLVCTFDAEFQNPYGSSLLERAYNAWYEKWMHGGAKKMLRLRMVKDAYLGDIFWYPPDQTLQLPSGETLKWSDVARQMVEARQSGSAMTLPLMYDSQGRKLVDYSPPRDTGGATSMFDWKRDLDHEIWKALEVPPEIIEAARVGSGWSGRSIPLLVALSAVQLEFSELLRCVDRDILRRLVEFNFGSNYHYELVPLPLADIVFDSFNKPKR
jgi:hypothetical protein